MRTCDAADANVKVTLFVINCIIFIYLYKLDVDIYIYQRPV